MLKSRRKKETIVVLLLSFCIFGFIVLARIQKETKEEEQFHNDYGIRIVSGSDPSCKELKDFILKELEIDSLPVFVFLDRGTISYIDTGIMSTNSFSESYQIAYEDKEVSDSYRWKQVLGKQIDLSVKDLNGNKIDLGEERICLEIADVQCDACVDQYVYHMPNIEETYGDRDLTFVTVYLNDEKEDILSFFREYNAARIEELRSEKQSGVQIK